MFKMQDSAQKDFKWPVTVNVPKDGGTFSSYTFTATFRMQEQSKMDSMIERFKNDDQDILKEVVVGWDENEVQDANGNPIPFTPEARDRLIDIPYVRTGLLKAYFDATSGNKAKKGN